MQWQDRRLLDLFGIEHPILQAPMAGVTSPQMAIATSEAGALGSIAGAMLTLDGLRQEFQMVKQGTSRPFNVNFFVHKPPAADAARDAAWRRKLAGYYGELGVAPDAKGPSRAAFDAAACELVLEFKPKVASFHFGLPDKALMQRLKAAGIVVIASATTVEEARWLEAEGADAVIAQGAEAGGHRGMFLVDDVARQPGTMALVPQVVDAVKVPVIAAGGIGDGRGIAAALALGAAGAQIGTAFMLTPEAKTVALHRAALKHGKRRQHDAHQRIHRSSRARHREPHRKRARAHEPGRAGVSAGRRGDPAAAWAGRSPGLHRLYATLERAGTDAGT
jgi:nitronate monooxygenase